MKHLTTTLAAIALLAGSAFSADVTVTITGSVLSNSYSGAMFGGVNVNDTAVLTYSVSTPGTDVVPNQLVNYAINLGSFDLNINGSTGAALAGATNLQIQNDFPAADGFRINQTQLATGQFFESGWGAGPTFFSTTDITQLAGTYDVLANMTSFGYIIQGGGGAMEILPEVLVINAPGGNVGAAYCFGDGSGASCPCSAFGGTGEGCMTTSGSGATLTGTGNADVANDSFTLTVSGGPANKPGIFFQGTNQLSNPAGDGILCSNSNMRYAVNSLDGTGSVNQTGFGQNTTSGSSMNYQYWFRDTGNTCGAGFNFSNGWAVTWN